LTSPLPLTLLVGFLGSGKTTLLNQLLNSPLLDPLEGGRAVVIVNEFGDVGLDGALLDVSSEGLVELPGGCLCCTIQGDLLRTLRELLRKRSRLLLPLRFDRILIEASGLASPGPILRTLLVEENLAAALAPPRVVALVATGSLGEQLEQHPEVREQLAHADTVVLSHWDRAADDQRANAREIVGRCAPGAKVVSATKGVLANEDELAELLQPAPDLATLRERVESHAHDHSGGCDGQHTQGVSAVSLTSEAPLDREVLDIWLHFLARRRDPRLLRIKGLVRVTDGACLEVQGVGEWYGSERASSQDLVQSQLVLIGVGLDEQELRRGWAKAGGKLVPDPLQG